jgi:hypothetical protein
LGTCKLREHEAPLIRAHILPASFYRDTNPPGAGPAHIIGTDPDEYTQRSPTGIYDTDIVCEACERLFTPYDDYAAELLIDRRDSAFQQYLLADKSFFRADDFDYAKLKLFIISVLWRASVSTRPFFHRISLGPFEQKAREMILRRDPGDSATFSTILMRWTVQPGMHLPAKLIANPYQLRHNGHHRARVYLGSFVADTSVERRPLPSPLFENTMSPERPLIAYGRDLHTSNDLSVFGPALMKTRKGKRPSR